MFVVMSEPTVKCENNAGKTILKKLFHSLKISYFCSFGYRGNLEFLEFLQKKFYNINYWA